MRRFIVLLTSLLAIVSCSTTRVLSDGQYRLERNTITVNGNQVSSKSLMPYVKQQSNKYFIFGWNPLLNIYNWADTSATKKNSLWKKIGTPPVVFNESLVDASIDNIKSHLDYLGFYNSDVSSEITKRGRRVKVQYTVTPGRQYRIDSIRYNVPEGAFGDEFRADLPNTAIKKGDFLSEHLLETESDRGAEFFRNNGYYTFNNGHYFFFADTVSIPGSAVLDYEIRDYSRQDGPSTASALRKFNFGDVTISHAGNIKVNEKFVKSFNSIHPGELYSDKIVNSTYNRFSALKTFNSVNVELNQKDSSTVDCNINLSASSMQGFKVNFETSSSSNGLIGLSPQFSYFHKNLFHNGERFDISLSGDFQFRPKDKTRSNEFGMSTKLSLPGIIFVSNNVFKGNNIPRTEIGLSFNYQNRPEYTKSAISGDLGFTAGTVSGMQFKFNLLQLGFVKVFAISDEFAKTLEKNPLLKYSYQSHLDSGVGLQFVNSNASSSVPKESYHFEYGKIDLSGNLMSLLKLKSIPYSQYVRAEVSAGGGLRLGESRSFIAANFTGGIAYAYGNSLAMPFEKRFYCGGATSMRGWQARTLGPGFSKPDEGFIIPSQTGDIKLEFDLELRFRMFWKFEGALFAETGNVWLMNDFKFKDFYKSLGCDWGAGLRLNLDFLVLRLDLGMKIHDPARDPDSRWLEPSQWFAGNGCSFHFGVGYPF